MPLKVAVFDLDDTVISPNGRIVDGMADLFTFLDSHDIKSVIASNKGSAECQKKLSRAGIKPHALITKDVTGENKGSPEYYFAACKATGCKREEGIYIGHSKFDMATATNARTIFINAVWAGSATDYGVKIKTPSTLIKYISLFLLKNHPWYARLDSEDRNESSVIVRAMMDCHGGGNAAIEQEFVNWLKRGHQTSSTKKFEKFATHHFIASLHLSGIAQKLDYWTTYPGHNKGSGNGVLAPILDVAARYFHDKYVNLLVRHTDSTKSAYARAKGQHVPFDNQTTSMKLSSEAQGKIEGKTILVVDDFTTEGNSFEWARNAFLHAGAKQIILTSFGKYPRPYHIRTIKDGVSWNVFKESTVMESDFHCDPETMKTEVKALQEFVQSYEVYNR
jgi:phosphoribosylpyrophosphate synthetase